MKIVQNALFVLEADSGAIVRLLDGLKGLPPVEQLRVFVVDSHNFTPSWRGALVGAGVHVEPSDDGQRFLFALCQEDARRLLSMLSDTKTDKPLPPHWIDEVSTVAKPGELRVIVFLGTHAFSSRASLEHIRKRAPLSPAFAAVLAGMRSAQAPASKETP